MLTQGRRRAVLEKMAAARWQREVTRVVAQRSPELATQIRSGRMTPRMAASAAGVREAKGILDTVVPVHTPDAMAVATLRTQELTRAMRDASRAYRRREGPGALAAQEKLLREAASGAHLARKGEATVPGHRSVDGAFVDMESSPDVFFRGNPAQGGRIPSGSRIWGSFRPDVPAAYALSNDVFRATPATGIVEAYNRHGLTVSGPYVDGTRAYSGVANERVRFRRSDEVPNYEAVLEAPSREQLDKSLLGRYQVRKGRTAAGMPGITYRTLSGMSAEKLLKPWERSQVRMYDSPKN